MTTSRTPWTVTALMALGTFVSMFALTTLIEDRGWLRTVFLVLALVTGANLLVRAATRSRFLPTVASLATAIVVMIPLFAVDEDGVRDLLPTPSAIGDLWQAMANGVAYAADTPAPAVATTPLVALVTGFAVAVFIVADHLAASWRAVAVSGVILMLPWTPAIFLQYQVPMWALFATAACWMIAMGAARSSMVTHRTAPLSGAVIATGAALLVTVLVVPAALGGNGWGSIPRFNAPDSFETSTRLNLALDLRNSLTVNSEQVVMTYTSTGNHPDTLRVYTYRSFDGSTWTREKAEPTDTVPAAGTVLWPAEPTGWDAANRVTLAMNVTRLSERNLPIPTLPRAVDVDDSWQYSPSRDEVTTSGKGTRDLQYSIDTDLAYFTAENLQATQAAINAGGDDIGGEYTDVPSSVDLARLQSLAMSITQEATSQYDQAVALQNYLRNTENFTYDTSVSPEGGGDSVSQFLDDRAGYCVQFATTMVMLSRSLGIPARLAVGFLGGHLTDNNIWAVRSGDAHAWPELYFPGEGWVRFEPTPAVQTGSAPQYTMDTASGGFGSGSVTIPSAAPTTGSNPNAPVNTTDPESGSGDTSSDSGVAWWLIVVLALVAVAAAAGAWMLRQRAAARATAHGPDGAWASLRARVPEAMRWPLSLTPLEAAEDLSNGLRSNGTPLTDSGAHALASLRDVVSDHRYAPPGLVQSEATEEWLAAQVDAVVQEANAAAKNRPDRVGAQSAPRHDS